MGGRRANGLQGPLHPRQVGVIAAYLSALASFVAYTAALGVSGALALILGNIGGFVVCIACWVYIETTDPALEGGIAYPCLRFSQAKAEYCAMCKKQVPGLDHHCMWLNTCIGKRNYVHFVLLTSVGLLQFASVVATGVAVVVLGGDALESGSIGAVARVLVGLHALVASGILVAFGTLLTFHVYLMAKGYGTYDYLFVARTGRLPRTKRQPASATREKAIEMRQRWEAKVGGAVLPEAAPEDEATAAAGEEESGAETGSGSGGSGDGDGGADGTGAGGGVGERKSTSADGPGDEVLEGREDPGLESGGSAAVPGTNDDGGQGAESSEEDVVDEEDVVEAEAATGGATDSNEDGASVDDEAASEDRDTHEENSERGAEVDNGAGSEQHIEKGEGTQGEGMQRPVDEENNGARATHGGPQSSAGTGSEEKHDAAEGETGHAQASAAQADIPTYRGDNSDFGDRGVEAPEGKDGIDASVEGCGGDGAAERETKKEEDGEQTEPVQDEEKR